MKILLVEDEVHKRDELIQCVKTVYGIEPQIVDCVNDAVLAVIDNDFDLIILDMALSTFSDNSGDKKKGHDQAQGGIEVLRALKSRKKTTKIIIITQYPDFYIGGVKVKLQKSISVVKEKYNQDIIGAVLYTYKSQPTLQKITSVLRKHA